MGNIQCCSRRNKMKNIIILKKMNLQSKIVKHMTNKKLEFNISKQKKEK